MLATHYEPLPVFVGSALALTVQSAVAVAAGAVLSTLPSRPVHAGAGLLLLLSAVLMWQRRAGDGSEHRRAQAAAETPPGFLGALGAVFLVVFIAEWGDLTQLGTAALAARYGDPLTVFCGATMALWAVTALAVLVGNRAGKLLDPERTKKIAAAVFALIGLSLLVGLM